MTCDEIHPLMTAYFDDELDVATAITIDRHLRDCPQCRRDLEATTVVQKAVSQPAVYFPASSDFADRIRRSIRAEIAPPLPAPTIRLRRWMWPALTTGLAAALVLAGMVFIHAQTPAVNNSGQEAIASHIRSLQANHLLDVESTDQHTVKPWFAGRVDFSPPVIDLSAEGFPLIGGRMDYLDQNPVAALIYRRNKHVISVFVSTAKSTTASENLQGYHVIPFQCNGLSCRAVSDLNEAELRQFVELFEAQRPASTRS